MQELDFDGVKYRTGKMTAFQQFHVFRKLMPLFSGLGETQSLMPQQQNGDDTGVPAHFWSSLGPAAQAIADMSQQDSEFILRTCLQAVQRQNPTGQWARLTTSTGDLMFEDLELATLLQLAFAVIQDNLSNFFGAGARANGLAGNVGSPSPSPSSL